MIPSEQSKRYHEKNKLIAIGIILCMMFAAVLLVLMPVEIRCADDLHAYFAAPDGRMAVLRADIPSNGYFLL